VTAPPFAGTVNVVVNAGAAQDAAGNATVQGSTSLVSDRNIPHGTINPTGVGSVTGTASDDTSAIVSVRVSIFDGTAYWDGTGFNSTTEVFLTAVTNDGFAHWSVAMPQAGTYTVHAQITDDAGNVLSLTQSVIVT
jgi:hypothetical protein